MGAEMRRHPCILGDPQQRDAKLEVAVSPLPWRGPKRGRKCYVTHAFLGIPNKGDLNWKWLPPPYLLRSPQEGGNATSPLHFRGSSTNGTKIIRGCLTLAFSGAHNGAEMRRHPCIPGDPQKGDQNQKWLPHRCLVEGPKGGGNATSPLHSSGSSTNGCKIRSGCLTLAFSWAQKRAEMLCHPCTLGDPQQTGAKSVEDASPL